MSAVAMEMLELQNTRSDDFFKISALKVWTVRFT